MKFEDLLQLPLQEVLENYGALYNLECGYYYGIAHYDDIEKIYEKYNIENDYPEAFTVEQIIPNQIMTSYQDPIINYNKIEKIMKNLNITTKK